MAPQRVYHWLQMRRSDTIALAVLWITLAQLAAGLIIVKAVSAQTPSQEVMIDRLENRSINLDDRVTKIETMNLPARLAVLEKSADEVSQVKLLIYGVFVTLIGSLLAQIVQIRGQRRNRREESVE
jgi:hypothetical protein